MKFRHIFRFIFRNYKFNLLWVITITFTLLLLYHIQVDLDNSYTNLEDMSNNTKVTATVRILSDNIQDIPYELIQELKDTNYIENSYITSTYKAYVAYPYSNLSINNGYEKLIIDNFAQANVLAITSLDMLKNYDVEVNESLFDSSTESNWIFVNKSEFNSEHLSIGDEFIISGEFIPSNYHYAPSEAYQANTLIGLKFKIVGTFDSSAYNLVSDNIFYIANNDYIIDNYRNYIIHEEIPNELYPYIGHDINPIPHVHSANFVLRNKLHLSEFKNLVYDSILTDYNHYDLVIDDTLHEVLTSPLRKQIETKKTISILLVTILIFIQFVITFISTYRKIPIIALLRIHGNKAYVVFLSIIVEHMITLLFSSIIFILYLLVNHVSILTTILDTNYYLFFISYFIGTTLSAVVILTKAPMTLLFKKE